MSKHGQPKHFVRAWRAHRGLTQEQLAERMEMDRSYLSQIETGKRRYDQPFLEAAAAALNCTPADLLVRDPTAPEGIWSIWDTVPETQRGQAIEVLKTFTRKAG